jgi:hypothetical protein
MYMGSLISQKPAITSALNTYISPKPAKTILLPRRLWISRRWHLASQNQMRRRMDNRMLLAAGNKDDG